MLDAILADLRQVKDEKFGSDVVVKGFDCAIEKFFCLQNEYGYSAD